MSHPVVPFPITWSRIIRAKRFYKGKNKGQEALQGWKNKKFPPPSPRQKKKSIERRRRPQSGRVAFLLFFFFYFSLFHLLFVLFSLVSHCPPPPGSHHCQRLPIKYQQEKNGEEIEIKAPTQSIVKKKFPVSVEFRVNSHVWCRFVVAICGGNGRRTSKTR